MLDYKELTTRWPKAGLMDPKSFFMTFCQAMPSRYRYLKEQSVQYWQDVGPGAVVHRVDKFPFPAIALASQNKRTLYVSNIVPKEQCDLDIRAYNIFLTELSSDLKKFVRETGGIARIALTSGNAALEDIISSVRSRTAFEKFLTFYPKSRHPCDVQRLDSFIHIASGYSRKVLDLELLERYLVEDLKWDEKNAKWCRDRIQVGLEILGLYHRRKLTASMGGS